MACVQLQPYLKEFALRKSQLNKVYTSFAEELTKGLSRLGHASADTKCDITAMPKLPTGNECGVFLSVVLGLQLKVILLELNGEPEQAQINMKIINVSEDLLLTEDALYDFIIENVCIYVKECGKEDTPLSMGVTFSNPLKYTGPRESAIYRWGRAFQGPGPEQREVVYLLTVSLARNYAIEVVHIFVSNNTNGILMYCAYLNSKCRIGISATGGTNASYLERNENIEYLTQEQKRRGTTRMIINTEWAQFGCNGSLNFIRTEFDYQLDQESFQPGFHLFEKMVSGKNRCELFRLILRKVIIDKLLFMDDPNRLKYLDILEMIGITNLQQIYDIESDVCPDFNLTRKYLFDTFGMKNPSMFACFVLKYICEAISRRSAQLYATMISVLINQINEFDIIIGIDDALFYLKEQYCGTMNDIMKMFLHPEIKYEMINAKSNAAYGIGIGAGLCINK